MPELNAALNKARLQERILASIEMADQEQACLLLGLTNADPSLTMKYMEDQGEVLRLTVDGKAAYPVFQFDVDKRRVYSTIARLIAAKPTKWSEFRFLNWLTEPHADFGMPPSRALATEDDEIVAAFGREIEPQLHG